MPKQLEFITKTKQSADKELNLNRHIKKEVTMNSKLFRI